MRHGFTDRAERQSAAGEGQVQMLTKVTIEALANSVLAVPPVALNPDLSLNVAANAAQIRHLEAGGVTTLLYGGNANVHNWQVTAFDAWLTALEDAAGATSWLLPSVGPDWGKLMDEAAILKHRRFPVAMALPMIAPKTEAGVVRSLEEFVARSGVPLIVYIKADNYIAPDTLGRLQDQGVVFGIKYAVPRTDIMDDPYLAALVATLGRERIVSGFGEPPALPHVIDFGLTGFTAGCVCIAPFLSTVFRKALQAGDRDGAIRALEPFLELEALRERLGAIAVLHYAVTQTGIADMGPILPTLSLPDTREHAAIAAAARRLYDAEMAARAA